MRARVNSARSVISLSLVVSECYYCCAIRRVTRNCRPLGRSFLLRVVLLVLIKQNAPESRFQIIRPSTLVYKFKFQKKNVTI